MIKTIYVIGILFLFPLIGKALESKKLAPLKTELPTKNLSSASIINDCGALNEKDFPEFIITEPSFEKNLRSEAKLSLLSTKTPENSSNAASIQQTYAGKIKKMSCKNKDHKFYGVRNLKSVLNGAAFRGGANNVYNNEFGIKENENPLPEIALKNLCIQGFSNAVYLYSKNFKGPSVVNCKTQTNESNTLHYIRLQPERAFQAKPHTEGLETLIKLTHEQILNTDKNSNKKPRPVFVHCYNGWHASGRAAAFLLQQFCDADPATALSYWIENAANSYEESYKGIWKQIVKFAQLKNTAPFSQYKIDEKLKQKVCPDLKNYKELAEKNNKLQAFLKKTSTPPKGNH